MITGIINVCQFDSTAYVEKPTYRKIKAAVLKAGRFSVFEATESPRKARWFERLHKDPELEVFQVPFPWVGVRKVKP